MGRIMYSENNTSQSHTFYSIIFYSRDTETYRGVMFKVERAIEMEEGRQQHLAVGRGHR